MLTGSSSLAFRFLYTEMSDIANTVNPDRKDTADTFRTDVASSTGLITTPPPILHIPPMVVAARQTANTKKVVIYLSHDNICTLQGHSQLPFLPYKSY